MAAIDNDNKIVGTGFKNLSVSTEIAGTGKYISAFLADGSAPAYRAMNMP